MLVRELLAELGRCDQDAVVFRKNQCGSDGGTGFEEITSVSQIVFEEDEGPDVRRVVVE